MVAICPFSSSPGNPTPCLPNCQLNIDGICAFRIIALAEKEKLQSQQQKSNLPHTTADAD